MAIMMISITVSKRMESYCYNILKLIFINEKIFGNMKYNFITTQNERKFIIEFKQINDLFYNAN